MKTNIHASCIDLSGRGVLITGASGSGKSDLCLRLIMEFGAKLVSDDRTYLKIIKDKLVATSPKILQGLLEVRGIGIIKQPFCKQTSINLVINLVNKHEEVERFPEESFFEFDNYKIRSFNLYAKDASSPAKVLAALLLV